MEESKIKKVLAILLAILFVVSLTAVAVDAGGHWGRGMTTTLKASTQPAHTMPSAEAGVGGNGGVAEGARSMVKTGGTGGIR